MDSWFVLYLIQISRPYAERLMDKAVSIAMKGKKL